MKLLTLKSGSDFEQTSNTGFLQAESDAKTKLYFSKKAYINEYTKRENLFSWNGSKFRMKKTQIYHKDSFIDILHDLEFDLTIEDAFKVEITTSLISIHIMSTSSVFKFQSISFVVDGVIKNFYYAGTVVAEYAGVKEFHVTREKSIDFHKSVGSDAMYITLTFNMPASFETLSVLWMNYVDPEMKMIVDFDSEVIPQIKYGGESYIVSKRIAKHLLNINYYKQYYQLPESFYNINLTYGFRYYSNWKTLVFVINEHFPDTNQISVKSLSLELRSVGNVINAMRRGNENLLSLGSIYIYDKDFAIHYENHPWFPGFHNYAVYNYTGALKLVGDSTNPEFVEYNAYDENNPSNIFTPSVDDTNNTDNTDDTDEEVVDDTPTDSVNIGDSAASDSDDGNTENAIPAILPSTYPNGDIVLNNLKFPWELLIILYDYDDYTFDTGLSFDDHYWHYAILDQMKIINGNYEIIKAGKVNMGNYIIMPLEPIEFPIILFTKYKGYYESTGNSRLTQMSAPENHPTSVINVNIHYGHFNLNTRRTEINIDVHQTSMCWIYPDETRICVIRRSSTIDVSSNNSVEIISERNTDILYHNETSIDLIGERNTDILYHNGIYNIIEEHSLIKQEGLILSHSMMGTISDEHNTTIQLDNVMTEEI